MRSVRVAKGEQMKIEKTNTIQPKKSTVLLCNKCKDIIYSRYSGEWVTCSCKSIYVDQTEHYTRVGGDPNGYQSFSINVDWTKTDKSFSHSAHYRTAEMLALYFSGRPKSKTKTGRVSSQKEQAEVLPRSNKEKLSKRNRKGRKTK